MKHTLLIVIFHYIRLNAVSAIETYNYEQKHFFGLGRRLMPNPNSMLLNFHNRNELPPSLPTTNYAPSRTFKSLYQGIRGENDTRVFTRRFEYEPKVKGQHVLCEGMFNCSITFLAAESTEAIPILLRGGAGYKHFTVIVKAKPGRELKGQVRAYCKKKPLKIIQN